MHSPVQVYRPEWNSGFCLDAEGSVASRRSVLEAAVEANAARGGAAGELPVQNKDVPCRPSVPLTERRAVQSGRP